LCKRIESLSTSFSFVSPLHPTFFLISSQQNNQPSSTSDRQAEKPLTDSLPACSSTSALQTGLSRTRRASRRSQGSRSQADTTRRNIRRQRLNNLLAIRKLRRLEDDTLDSAARRVECCRDSFAAGVGGRENLTGCHGGQDELVAEFVCCGDGGVRGGDACDDG